MINKLNKMILCIVLLIISITVNIYLDSYIVFNRAIRTDQEQHFYDIKRWYESGKIPVTSTRFTNSRTIDDEFVTGRVPGGAYYIFYKLASENLIGAKIINLLFSLSIFFIFCFGFIKNMVYLLHLL